MAANRVLVDSSVYIGLLRMMADPLALLEAVALGRDLVACGVVCCEVGRGLVQPRIRQAFKDFWSVMIYVPTDNSLWAEAEELLWTLDRAGKMIPLPDAIIACCARRAEADILTFDRHFALVPGLRVRTSLADI